MTEMILLGAGASAEAGIPTSYGMTNMLYERMRVGVGTHVHAHALAFAIGGLLYDKGIKGENPLTGVDVEQVYNVVELLANRHETVPVPFVETWHPFIVEMENRMQREREAQRRERERLQRMREIEAFSKPSISEAYGSSGNPRTLAFHASRPRIADFSHSSDDAPPNVDMFTLFASTAAEMVRLAVEIVWLPERARIAYLAPILDLCRMQGRLVIATLNYDNAIEQLARSQKVKCETGIEQWQRTGNFSFGDEGLYLLKMHGSANWRYKQTYLYDQWPQQVTTIEAISDKDMKPTKPVVDPLSRPPENPPVLFGGRNKLTARGPFLDMLRAFKEELAKSDILTVIGYAFRDEHINACIEQWQSQSPKHRLRIVKRSLNRDDPSLSPILRDGRADIILKPAGKGLTHLYNGG